MERLLGVLVRHKIVVTFTVIVIALPILMALTPLMLLLTAAWTWVALSEAGRAEKRRKNKCD